MASVKQQHYRRLMKEQKSKSTIKTQQRIDHPLAKYNALNQLSCLVCGISIKNELLWTTHLHSRKHKDAVLVLKSSKSSTTSQQPHPHQKEAEFLKPSAPPISKRKTSEVEGGDTSAPSAKKPKQDMQPPSSSVAPPPPISADSADTSYKSTTAKSKRKRSKGKSRRGNEAPPTTSSGLPSDFFDSGVSKTFHGHGEEVYYESSSDSEEEGMEVKRPGKGTATSGLPSDFFDKMSSSSKTSATSKDKGGNPAVSRQPVDKSSIPEGFFDDPLQDAKARKVEYKDPMMDEWEKFQKTIKKEDDISQAIQFEEDEEANEERELIEVNEQVSWFTKAEELRQKQEALLANRAQTTESNIQNNSAERGQPLTSSDDNIEDSDDELDIDMLLNWRSKKS